MTWTYTPTDIATSEKDQIRTEIGDVDSQAPLLPDEAINWAITQERNYWASAARCAEMIARLFMRRVDVRLGRSMMITYSKTAEQYFDMARRLRCKAMGTVAPYVGGMTVSDKVSIATNTGLVAPSFTRTMMENPWTGGYSTDSLPPIGGEEPVDTSTEF
jgi:hypothetical protein